MLRKQTLIAIVVAVILLLVIYGLVVILRRSPVEREETTPSLSEAIKVTPLPLKKQNIFENLDKRFSVALSDSWRAVAEYHSDVVIFNPQTECKVSVSRLANENRTTREIIEEFIANYSEFFEITDINIEDIVASGFAGSKFTATAPEIGEEEAAGRIGMAYVDLGADTLEFLATCPDTLDEALQNIEARI